MENKIIFAFDRKIKKRVVHKVVNGWAVSLISGSKFKYKPKSTFK